MSAPAPVPVLLGSTASGKTSVSLPLAESLGAEILSVDSRQIYRGLSIGSAAPTPAERARVPHHLVEAIEPTEVMTAGEYGRRAAACIDTLRASGSEALLVGGSGLYLRAALGGLDTNLPRDPALRETLRRRAVSEGAEALHAELATVDPDSAARISARDVQRITRALEIHLLTGRPASALRRRGRETRLPARVVVLERDRDDLEERIRARVAAMVAAGLVQEVRALLDRGVTETLPALRSVGYVETIALLRGELEEAQWVEAIVTNTRRYGKRQRTWFRGIEGATWLAVPAGETANATALRVRRVLEPE